MEKDTPMTEEELNQGIGGLMGIAAGTMATLPIVAACPPVGIPLMFAGALVGGAEGAKNPNSAFLRLLGRVGGIVGGK